MNDVLCDVLLGGGVIENSAQVLGAEVGALAVGLSGVVDFEEIFDQRFIR